MVNKGRDSGIFQRVRGMVDGLMKPPQSKEKIPEQIEQEKDPTDLEAINDRVQEIVEQKEKPIEAIKKILAYFATLDDYSVNDELLEIFVSFDVNLTKQEDDQGLEPKIEFRVVVEDGRFKLIPTKLLARGWAILDEISGIKKYE